MVKMAVMKNVISGFSSILGVPKPTVNMHYRLLREAGRFVQSGRGRGAAHVGPEDAAMLLLSLLHPGEIKNTGTITKYRYDAIFDGALQKYPEEAERYVETVPPFDVLRNSPAVPRTLGEVLAIAIDTTVRYGGMKCDKGSLIHTFDVEINNIVNFHGILIASGSSGMHRIKYLDKRPDDVFYELEEKRLFWRKDHAKSIGFIETTKSISGVTIKNIANLFREFKLREGESFIPSYDPNN
jgi:hypothetical protein